MWAISKFYICGEMKTCIVVVNPHGTDLTHRDNESNGCCTSVIHTTICGACPNHFKSILQKGFSVCD